MTKQDISRLLEEVLDKDGCVVLLSKEGNSYKVGISYPTPAKVQETTEGFDEAEYGVDATLDKAFARALRAHYCLKFP